MTLRHVSSAACASNLACAASGLAGDCCPTAEGARLGCCDAHGNTVAKVITSARCDDNAACKALGGLSGDCCPTDEGSMLGCCPVEVVRAK